jgi:DNA-binding GntR family transcriptional regulator
MVGSTSCRDPGHPEELAELRLLLELPAVRRLADRGLSGQELALVNMLADATMRAARTRDTLGYLQADMAFHLGLVELTADPALADIARLLLAYDPRRAPRVEESGRFMARAAREHQELVGMLADGAVRAADELLRIHVSRLSASAPAPARFLGPASIRCAGA